jgi:hypothetical protein
MTMTATSRALLACAALAVGAPPVFGQTSPPPVRRLEVSVGGGVFGRVILGQRAADERSAAGGPYRLFDSETVLDAVPVVETRVGVSITRQVAVEARVSLGRPRLETSVSSDAEGAVPATATERLDQYLVDGGVRVHLDAWRVGGFVPFVAAGAGYVRELHAGRSVVEDGRLLYVGGGAMQWLIVRAGGVPRAFGLRVDGRVYVLSGGVLLGKASRRQPAISAALAVAF